MQNNFTKLMRSYEMKKSKLKLVFLIISLFLLFGATKNASAGTAFYVDPTASGGGDGTYASPWNSLSQVNEHSFSTGDDVYFKANTTLNVPAGEYLDIDWNGISGDWVIIGAYYGDGQFGLDGGARPIIDGQTVAPANDSYRGLIDKQHPSGSAQTDAYVEVKDLRIQNSGFIGIAFKLQKNVKVTNCHTYHTKASSGIAIVRTDTATIDGNTVEDGNYEHSSYYRGAAMEITGSDQPDVSKNTIVTNNIVFKNHGEGIGIYKYSSYAHVTGNIVYDVAAALIYAAGSQHVEIDNNIVYTSNASPWSPAMGIPVESELADGYCFTGYIDIHDNYVANCSPGISLSTENTSCNVTNSNIYNNIIVDSLYNFGFWGDDSGWNTNNIYNNISYTSNNSTMYHSNNYSPTGITWGTNIFDDDVSGNAAVEACTVASPLEKTTGWDSLTAGAVTTSDFDLSNNGLAGRTACFGGDTTPPSAPSGLSVD